MTEEGYKEALELMRDMREQMATKDDIADLRSKLTDTACSLRSEMRSLCADVASNIAMVEKRLCDQLERLSNEISDIQQLVIENRSAINGRAAAPELEGCMRRLEAHLKSLPEDEDGG